MSDDIDHERFFIIYYLGIVPILEIIPVLCWYYRLFHRHRQFHVVLVRTTSHKMEVVTHIFYELFCTCEVHLHIGNRYTIAK